jgi:hypothetical protein
VFCTVRGKAISYGGKLKAEGGNYGTVKVIEDIREQMLPGELRSGPLEA